ncbi:phosphonate C-P lyase system protein PhnG [Rhizobium mayense]|uniref:Phosphonate C-P lyase system protein PhnG n=1 Tax=Rhizobium mayense TaxID=1312184 RepID=A0ABT7K4K5_9HYPH|nr:phosphonate C-P lyase system protein PhnG [Rhizobium mayense]MDL2402079.1 phosphonate C-P lyase system protein PhnG [Rhizobium mayense]
MTENKAGSPVVGPYCHADVLEILAAGRPEYIKACAEAILETIGSIDVLSNRTGLAMLPYEDTVHGTAFHLGEVLVSEAHIDARDHDVKGYGGVVGRDLEHAMAIAVVDASIAASHALSKIQTLLDAEHHHRLENDDVRLKMVEATRVQMETF